MKKWAYRVYRGDEASSEFQQRLQELGDDGWELVTIIYEPAEYKRTRAYFKKEISVTIGTNGEIKNEY